MTRSFSFSRFPVFRLLAVLASLLLPAMPAAAQDVPLKEAEVRKLIRENEITQREMSFIYLPDGKFDATDGRMASGGTYRVEKDGRVCWKNSMGINGCFEFYRRGKELRVRRNDGNNKGDIGRVKLAKRKN